MSARNDTARLLREILVLLPLCHLILSSLFLTGYCFSFGGGLLNFISPSDIFSFSLTNFFWIYFPITLFAGSYFGRRFAYVLDSYENIPEDAPENIKDTGSENINKIKFHPKTSYFILILSIFSIFSASYASELFFYFCAMVIFIIANNVLRQMLIYSDIDKKSYIVFNILLFSVLHSLSVGMCFGKIDQYLSYNSAIANKANCGNYIVLRRISHNYLSIRNNGKHEIIDLECNPKFMLNVIRRDSTSIQSTIQWWRERIT